MGICLSIIKAEKIELFYIENNRLIYDKISAFYFLKLSKNGLRITQVAGTLQAALPGAAQHLATLDAADTQLESGVESVRYSLRREV
jgi:hypothetical protein